MSSKTRPLDWPSELPWPPRISRSVVCQVCGYIAIHCYNPKQLVSEKTMNALMLTSPDQKGAEAEETHGQHKTRCDGVFIYRVPSDQLN